MIVEQIKEARSAGYGRHADPKEETQTSRLAKDLMSLNLFEKVFAPGKFHL